MNRSGLARTFSSLQTRNFRLFFIGQTISNTGNWLTNVALTLLVLKATGSGIAVGLLAACQYGPILVLSLWGGAIADRSDKLRMLIWTQSLEMAQSAILAVLAFLPSTPLPWLYGVALGGGVLLSLDNPLRRSFVTEMVPRKDLANAVVLYSAIVNLSRIFGPTLAGLLAETYGFGWCFSLDAASYVAVLICLFMMRPAELTREPARPARKGEIVEGLRSILADPVLWIPFAMFAAIGTLSYNFSVTLPLLVIDSLGGTRVQFTQLYSVFSAGAVVCALIVAHRNLVRIRHIVIGAFAFGAALFVMAAAPTVLWEAPAVFVVGMAAVLYMTSTTSIVQIEAKPTIRGRVLALQTTLMGGSTAIGGPLLGYLADRFGGRAPILLGAVVCVLAAVFGWSMSRHQDLHRQKIA